MLKRVSCMFKIQVFFDTCDPSWTHQTTHGGPPENKNLPALGIIQC